MVLGLETCFSWGGSLTAWGGSPTTWGGSPTASLSPNSLGADAGHVLRCNEHKMLDIQTSAHDAFLE
jgi:hypothetical protein